MHVSTPPIPPRLVPVLAALLAAVAAIAPTIARGLSPDEAQRATPTFAGSAPKLLLSTYIGASDQDWLSAVTTDKHGNSYVAGSGSLAPIPVSNPTHIGPGDGNPVVAKFTPDGTLVYATYIGGSSDDYISDIALDAAGNVYIAGITRSSDFPIVAAPAPAIPFDELEIFVAKLSADGSALVYSSFLGPVPFPSAPVSLAVTPDGAACIASSTRSASFPLVHPLDSTIEGLGDATITKVNAEGTEIVYSTLLGGRGDTVAVDIAVDRDGNAYVVGGITEREDFPLVNPAITLSGNAFTDGFITKFSSDGSTILYSSILGGSLYDTAYGVAVDAQRNAYVSGRAQKTFPITSRLQPDAPNYDMAFLMKLDPTGSRIVYSTALTGESGTDEKFVSVDKLGRVLVVGTTISQSVPLANAFQTHIAFDRHFTMPAEDLYMIRLSPSGSGYDFATYFGGLDVDFPYAIAVDPVGTVYVVGTTLSVDFPTYHALERYPGDGQFNAFLVKFALTAPPIVKSTAVVEKPGKALRVKIVGSNLQEGAEVYVGDDAEPWAQVTATGAKVTLKGGDGLGQRFPVGEATPIRIVNSDGGGAYTTVTR